MRKLNFACVVGVRPNFMKIAPVLRALRDYQHTTTTLIHTGQHYDAGLSDVFFDELGIKHPEASLEVGSGKHGVQTARMLERLEPIFESNVQCAGHKFDRVIVVGDGNSTLAAALAASKLSVPVAHVEAGLRSGDRAMPEEINRLLTDAISDLKFITEPSGRDNLINEGHDEKELFLIGNVMIDTLLSLLPKARERDTLSRFGLEAQQYGIMTLHRPSNVDDCGTLTNLLDIVLKSSDQLPMVFAIHPRTAARLASFGLIEKLESTPSIVMTPPLGYLDFLALTSQSRVIVTDSGGLQEEATALGVPCLTTRDNTERPVTVSQGTNTLVGRHGTHLLEHLKAVINGTYKKGAMPDLWDGMAAKRIARILVEHS